MFDTQSLRMELSGLEALSDDPMRRPFGISTFYGNSSKPDIVQIMKRIHLKFIATVGANRIYWVGKSPYFSKRSRVSFSTAEKNFVGQKWPRITYAEAVKLVGAIETEKVFSCRLEYMEHIEAVSVLFSDALDRRNKKRSLRDVLASAICIENMEYLANGCRWRCRNGICPADIACGATGNEGAHFDLKSWVRNVMAQTIDRANSTMSFSYLRRFCRTWRVLNSLCAPTFSTQANTLAAC